MLKFWDVHGHIDFLEKMYRVGYCADGDLNGINKSVQELSSNSFLNRRYAATLT